ncbi:MAG: L-aspartate oxidase [Phycisphaerales bacterium]|nr:L-aspartate oxidase [Phycisphaerales bacterium]
MSIFDDRRYLIPFCSRLLPQLFTDSLIIGGGVAGMRGAIEAAMHGNVIVLAKGPLDLSNSQVAQGGIAAALAQEDSTQEHFHDTMTAGAGLCEHHAVRVLVEEGPREIERLIESGMRIDRAQCGAPSLGLEGGHGRPRIVHSDGDMTGRELMRTLCASVKETPGIRLFDRCFALDLCVDPQGRVAGALTWHPKHGLQVIWSRATILAAGGAGQVYRETSNPRVATGDAIAMAWRAGAVIRDMEFMQFHPTTLYIAGAPRHLISEAVRGEGAIIVDRSGTRIMVARHPQGDLAPRDVVTRGIVEHLAQSNESHAFLDARSIGSAGFANRFPGLAATLAGYGIDAGRDLIPIHPAAHYTVGGVQTDVDGRTNLPGLFACGEVASNGVHGANRLASNSLLEGLVFGRRAVLASVRESLPDPVPMQWESRVRTSVAGELDLDDVRSSLRSAMWRNVGIVREGAKLRDCLDMFSFWGRYALGTVFETPEGWETQNLLTVGHLMTRAAGERRETRGSHVRTDWPDVDPDGAFHISWVRSDASARRERVGEDVASTSS